MIPGQPEKRRLCSASRGIAGIVVTLACACGTGLSAQATTHTLLPVWTSTGAANDIEVSTVVVPIGGARVLVWQPQAGEFLRLDGAGRIVGRVGRRGAGPGEFRAVTLAGLTADSLLFASDPVLRRTSLLTSDGRPVSTIGWPPAATRDGEGLAMVLGVQPLAILSGGEWMTVLTPSPRADLPKWWPGTDAAEALVIVKPDGTVERLLAALPDRDPPGCRVTYIAARTGPGSLATPWCQRPQRHISAPSARFALVVPAVEGREPGKLTVLVLDSTGRRLLDREIALRLTRATNAQRAEVRASLLTPGGPFGIQPEQRKAVEALQIPDVFPLVDRLCLGADGTIWLRRGGWGDVREWLVLDPAGNPFATFQLPATSTILNADRRGAWGFEVGEDDAPRFVRWRLQGR